MTRPAGAAGTATSKAHFYEETAVHHDEATDCTRMVRLSDTEATVAHILGVQVLGADGSWRARLTQAERHRISQLLAWASRGEAS